MEKGMRLERTKKGHPALWESGGGASNTGGAQIICGPHGEALTPVYVARGGHLSCGDHALFIVAPGYVVVEAAHHREDFVIRVKRITEIREHPAHSGRCVCGELLTGEAVPPASCIVAFSHEKDYPRNHPAGVEGRAQLLAEFSRGEWDNEPLPEWQAAIDAACSKATCYHCREPHFVSQRLSVEDALREASQVVHESHFPEEREAQGMPAIINW